MSSSRFLATVCKNRDTIAFGVCTGMICAYGGYQYSFLCGYQYGLRQESNFTKQNLLTATGTDNNNKTDLPLSKEEEDKIKWEEGRQRLKANRMMFDESAKRRN